jgi:hypothetical protein
MQERLEAMVRKAARTLEARGTCRLWKIPNDLRITGSGQMTWGEWTPCDFFGHTRKGTVVMIECKDISGDRIRKGGELRPQQLESLDTCQISGGYAGLLWAHQYDVVLLTAAEVEACSRGRRAIAWADAKRVCEPKPLTPESVVELIERMVT